MLSSDELNAFLRDDRAWRRAAQRPVDDDLSAAASINSREANWTIFRRGSSDNTFSLKFANSLRTTDASGSFDSAASRTRGLLRRRKWDANARCSPERVAPDPLQLMLARNLQRGRTTSNSRTTSHTRSPSPSSSSIARAQERQRAFERVTREFVELEKAERRDIVAAARLRWNTLTTTFFSEARAALLAEEMEERRFLFRAWQDEKYVLSEIMDYEQHELTNMTRRQFRQHCHLIRAETLARNRILTDEDECRDLLTRFADVEYLRALEAEIERCKRQERRLLRRLA